MAWRARRVPPLVIASERDMLLSATSSLSRAFVRAGNQSQLIVFEGLPHCFWNNNALPESHEAWAIWRTSSIGSWVRNCT